MKYIQKILLALVALVLATGCIREDNDDCDNVTIYFQYLADGDEDVLYQYMKKVDLYVAKPSFKLTPGRKYKVVAVGNAYERTEVVNLESETDFNNIYLQHPAWGTEEKVDGHDHNYMGLKEFYIPATGGFTVYRDTVTLYSAHVNVEIEINGLPAPENTREGEHPFALSIEQSNAQTDFNGNINVEEKGTCYPTLIYDYERKCYRTRDGREMIRGNIYNYLKYYEDEIDLTKQEATLPIAINFHDVNVDITLPDWVIIDGKPEWN